MVYLTETEKSALDSMACQKGKKRSELIREAVDHMINQYNGCTSHNVLDRAVGIWSDGEESLVFSK